MKTAAIVADNYKLDKFKEELTKAGFSFEISDFCKGVSNIKVSLEETKFMELKKNCRLC